MPTRMFLVRDQSTIDGSPGDYSLPRPGRPGEWMRAKNKWEEFELTSHPSRERSWNSEPKRIFLAEYDRKVRYGEEFQRGLTIRSLAVKSVRLVEEITPDWVHLDEHPDIRVSLVAEFRKANGNDADLPEWASLRNLKLKGHCFDSFQLAGVDFRGADLSRALLASSMLEYADFRGCDLTRGDLNYLEARGAEFSGANLTKVTFKSAELSGAHFVGATLRRVTCTSATLKGADLRNCDLTDAKFDFASMQHVFLAGADLTGASFKEAYLDKTNLRDVRISSEQLAQCGGLKDIKLTGAVVDGVRLDGAAANALVEKLKRKNPQAFGLDVS